MISVDEKTYVFKKNTVILIFFILILQYVQYCSENFIGGG